MMARAYTSQVSRKVTPLTRRSRRTQPMSPAQISMYSRRHLPDYTNDRCDACGELATLTIDKMNHWKQHLPAGSPGWKMFRWGYECFLCPETHRTKDGLISHLACHQYVPFTLFRSLSTASALHIAASPYHLQLFLAFQFKAFPETTDSTNSFPSLRYPCPECPKTFSNRGNLSVHRTKKHGYVSNAHKEAQAVDSDVFQQCEADERSRQEGAVPTSAASVFGDMAGLSRVPVAPRVDALPPTHCLSATDRHSLEGAQYATNEAFLPGPVDETTPGLEHDLGHASSSTTPLMTPPPPYHVESFDATCDARFGEFSIHGFGLPVLGGFNQSYNPFIAGVNVGNFSHDGSMNFTASAHFAQPSNGMSPAFPHATVSSPPPMPPQGVYTSHLQPPRARSTTRSRTSQSRRSRQDGSVEFADFGLSNSNILTASCAFASPMDSSALYAPPAPSTSLANAPRSMVYPPVPPPHLYAKSTMHPEVLPAASASQNEDFQQQQWASRTTERPEFSQQQSFAPQWTDSTFVQQQEQAYVAPHALDFTAADAMDVAASYAMDFSDVYSSWPDFGDAIMP
ncbi:uncharacterized protein SCHCODRAFT_02689220 [Schizophyllum commune H4-8]|uniref:uncharacterized protein n=1 Tax=Schizophyllum commune (strain H4-8 / FGSC 9210) TaxID=578458 RepID=UPI00216021D2|nr:uncharacterized protein SCHCODRAFT_02689220 [Schizophyllum commune H4-8]KAI5890890.1 hypothetical protein SCHCODRAFT_02689220 [Schizophyllum commune H4-8]